MFTNAAFILDISVILVYSNLYATKYETMCLRIANNKTIFHSAHNFFCTYPIRCEVHHLE